MKIKLNVEQKHALVEYVIMLFQAGAKAIYVGDILPFGTFEAFPELTEYSYTILRLNGISYDQPSGWFRSH